MGHGATPSTSRPEFVEDFADWARENTSTRHRFVAVRGDVIVGMAWLATVRRVPTPRSRLLQTEVAAADPGGAAPTRATVNE